MRFLPKLRLKKLNTNGVGHHALIAILVISAIAGIGAWRVWSSGAYASSSVLTMATKEGCNLAGRNWSSGDCKNSCLPDAGSWNAAGNLCTKYVSGTAEATCIGNGRVYLKTKAGSPIGCAQSEVDQDNSPRCWDPARPHYNKKPAGTTDLCVATREAIRETGGGTSGGGSTAPAEPGDVNITKSDCTNLLGRTWNDTTNNCRRKCADGSAIKSNNGVYYCEGYVATGITSEDACVNYLHRKWLVAGCAKRASDQTNSIQCKREAGFPNYYKDVVSNTDACHTSRANAKAAVESRNAASSAGTIVGGSQTTGALGGGGSGNGASGSSTALNTNNQPKPVGATEESAGPAMPNTADPTCIKNGKRVAANSNDGCPKGANLTCPGADLVKKKDEDGNERCYKKDAWQSYNQQQKAAAAAAAQASSSPSQDQVGTKVVVPVDDVTKEKCHLLGREFLAKKKGNQAKGCLRACRDKTDALSDNNLVCLSAKFNGVAYAESLDKDTCNNLHRQYIKLGAGYCAQFPNQEKKNSKKVNADQCASGYPVYIIQPGKKDECVTASFANQIQIVADKTKKSIAAVAKFPGAKVCNNLRKNMHWNGKQCVQDRVAEPSTSTGAASGGGGRGASGGSTGNPSTAPAVPTICKKNPDEAGCPRATSGDSKPSKPSTSGCTTVNSCGDTVKTEVLTCPTYRNRFGLPSGGSCLEIVNGVMDVQAMKCTERSTTTYEKGVFYTAKYIPRSC